jgi:hypothetical protein
LFKFSPKFERLAAAVPTVLAVLMASLICANGVRAQTPQGFPFRATYYEVEVLLHPEDQTISGQAKVEFIAQQPARTVVVELHQDLRVNSVKMLNGGTLEFERDNRYPLLLTSVWRMLWRREKPSPWFSITPDRFRVKKIVRRVACVSLMWTRPGRICCYRRAGFR